MPKPTGPSPVTGPLLMLLSACMFTCRSWEGGLYMTSEMVFTAIAGIVLLGDPAGWRFWTGGALILGSAVTVQVQRAFPWSQSG
jgi:hypothetical protein